MSFQAYINTIKDKTGKDPAYFLALAKQKGLLEPGVKTGQIVDWLKDDFDLGRGHAMALVVTFNAATKPKMTLDEQIASHFTGDKAMWFKPYEDLVKQVKTFGSDVLVYPGGSYLSLLRSDKKFAIIQITKQRMDIGIKRKAVDPTEKFAAAGSWNSMVTHRVQITDSQQIDSEVIEWLKQAYSVA